MKTKIIINGACGKMGSLAASTLQQHDKFAVIAALDHQDDLAAQLRDLKPDIVVDFTNATAVYQNAHIIIAANVRPVIGATGLLPEQITELQHICEKQKLGGVIAPNFSLGIALMLKYAANAIQYFDQVEIIETHHAQKIDAPSGTALHTAEVMAPYYKPAKTEVTSHEMNSARGASHHGIPIHSIRLPGRVAHQQVIFGGNGETLMLQHDAINRECFMPGLIMACEKVMSLTQLVYGLEWLLN